LQAQTAVGITLKDLKPLLFDSNRSVRKAMVELVQQIANVRSFRWWEIFPPADLISIMGSDNAEVAGIIHNMLFTQFVEGDDLNLQVRVPEHLRFHCVQLKRSSQPPFLVSAMSASSKAKS
jgi:hypothetical protein